MAVEECYNDVCSLDLTQEKSEDPYTKSYRGKLREELESILDGFMLDGESFDRAATMRIEALIRQLKQLRKNA